MFYGAEINPEKHEAETIDLQFTYKRTITRHERGDVDDSRMILKKILIGVLLCAVCGASAQDVPFEKKNFPGNTEFKDAAKAFKEGNKLYDLGGVDYSQALVEFEKAYAFNPNSAELNLKMGICHLNGTYRAKSLDFFKKAKELDPNIPRIEYLVGVGYQLNSKWDNAIEAYKKHLKLSKRKPDENPFFNEGEKRIVECNNGKTLQNSPVQSVVEIMDAKVNSDAADYGVVISPNGERMYFTSRRSGTTGGSVDENTNDYFEDIYFSKKEGSEWSTPVVLDEPVNTAHNDATIGLFNDGSTLLIYRDKGENGDIMETTNENGVWSEPKSLGPNINTEYHESSAWFSFDKKWLYFVSDRPDLSIGGSDIFRSRWNERNQTWGEPENLGRKVNSQYDEDGIFVHPDGKTIYFSSEGHNSMGGFDIFSAEIENGVWSKPVNLGWPINSPGDDVYFVVTADGKKGYFSSVRPDGFGKDDLYIAHIGAATIDTSATASDEELLAMAAVAEKDAVLISGCVVDNNTGFSVQAEVELFELTTGKSIATFKTNPESGCYNFAVPANQDYGLNIRSEGYLFHSEKVILEKGVSYSEHNHDIHLQGVDVGSQVILNNVFFDYNKWALKPAALNELQKVLGIMEINEAIIIELGGHTDNVGSDTYNQGLSKKRADSCRDWLVSVGIEPDRIQAKGYGESEPAQTNETEEGRAKNRRTELKIIGKK